MHVVIRWHYDQDQETLQDDCNSATVSLKFMMQEYPYQFNSQLQNYIPMHFHNSLPHIPFSGRNPNLKFMLRGRPKLLVLNKMDLADPAKSQVTWLLFCIF